VTAGKTVLQTRTCTPNHPRFNYLILHLLLGVCCFYVTYINELNGWLMSPVMLSILFIYASMIEIDL